MNYIHPMAEHHMRSVQATAGEIVCFFRVFEDYYRPLPGRLVKIPGAEMESLVASMDRQGYPIMILDTLMQHPYISLLYREKPQCVQPSSLYFVFFAL